MIYSCSLTRFPVHDFQVTFHKDEFSCVDATRSMQSGTSFPSQVPYANEPFRPRGCFDAKRSRQPCKHYQLHTLFTIQVLRVTLDRCFHDIRGACMKMLPVPRPALSSVLVVLVIAFRASRFLLPVSTHGCLWSEVLWVRSFLNSRRPYAAQNQNVDIAVLHRCFALDATHYGSRMGLKLRAQAHGNVNTSLTLLHRLAVDASRSIARCMELMLRAQFHADAASALRPLGNALAPWCEAP